MVGAGPYGLSVAAYLRALGVPVRVFGVVMGSWRHDMASGMFLKSTPDAVDLAAPVPGAELSDFVRAVGEPELTELTPIPCTLFVRYGQWFQDRHVGPVEETRVASVTGSGAGSGGAGGFTVRLEDGEEFTASAVVVASGLTGLARIPQKLSHLAPEGPAADALLSHTSQHADLSVFAGQRVAVVGGGQSALESAALMQESGATVDVLVRANKVIFGGRPVLHRSLLRRVVKPSSPLGTGWALAVICASPELVRRLPGPARRYILRRVLGPSGGWWLRDRVEGRVTIHTGREVARAEAGPDGIRLRLAGTGSGPAEMTVDHVLAATGYTIDISATRFLAPELRDALVRVPGALGPRLSSAFESSVPGLFFTGNLAAPAFGPMMRFVVGTRYAASRIAPAAARHAAQRTAQHTG
ncbi:NAD(P)-binding domain-containing protein [Streptacidiphilus sp. PB12-B1b]|nr:NAD(P)-binding domain-containing protein [Streptacidiphilus sp. PB12-B1b]